MQSVLFMTLSDVSQDNRCPRVLVLMSQENKEMHLFGAVGNKPVKSRELLADCWSQSS